jgi:hypothetical protein
MRTPVLIRVKYTLRHRPGVHKVNPRHCPQGLRSSASSRMLEADGAHFAAGGTRL